MERRAVYSSGWRAPFSRDFSGKQTAHPGVHHRTLIAAAFSRRKELKNKLGYNPNGGRRVAAPVATESATGKW